MEYLNKTFKVYVDVKNQKNHCMSLSSDCVNSGKGCFVCVRIQGKYTNYKKYLHPNTKSAKV